jgi:parallel beta-helix repeat protein
MAFFSFRRDSRANVRSHRHAQPQYTFRPLVEALEDRWVPSTLHVGPTEQYTTIQGAVTAAQSNDTIQVDPGTYTEQVQIDDTGHLRDNLTINGSGQNSTFIKAPALMTSPNAVVEVSGAQNVTIDNFTITGPASGANSGGSLYGIRIDGGGSATITNNHITAIEDTPFDGVQEGIAIDVGRASEAQSGSATISHNTIDNYQKGGILVSNVGSSATIDHNVVQGAGPTALIAQNGIQIGSGATATVTNNTISGNIYTPQTVVSTGILLFSPGAVTISNNTVSSNDVGIYSFGAIAPIIVHNDASANTFDGIILDTTSQAMVDHNSTNNNGYGDQTGNPTGDGGIALFNSTNNTISHNQSNNNKGDGIFADSASIDNVFSKNQASGNTNFDFEDQSTDGGTAGTGNTWTHNHGASSSPGGLA